MSEGLDDGQRKVLPKIEALLRLADKNPNPQEAAAAAAKAQELLVAYNLDASLIGQSGDDGKREEGKVRGGFYQHSRDLWHEVAELNFCLYWTGGHWIVVNRRRRSWVTGKMETYTDTKWETVHRLVGRKVNVAATKVMAQYLEAAIERLVEERIRGQNNLRFSNFAVSYRKGAAQNIIERLYQRRREMLKEEERKRREEEAAAVKAGRKGVSTETALTIASVTQSERDANLDHLYGEGWSARKRAERAEAARKRAEAEAAYAKWAAENPEEARKAEAERKAEEEKAERKRRRRRESSGSTDNVDTSAYYAGYDAADAIGLDPQMGSRVGGALSHG